MEVTNFLSVKQEGNDGSGSVEDAIVFPISFGPTLPWSSPGLSPTGEFNSHRVTIDRHFTHSSSTECMRIRTSPSARAMKPSRSRFTSQRSLTPLERMIVSSSGRTCPWATKHDRKCTRKAVGHKVCQATPNTYTGRKIVYHYEP